MFLPCWAGVFVRLQVKEKGKLLYHTARFKSLLVVDVYNGECKKEDHQSFKGRFVKDRQSLFAITNLPWILFR